MSSNNSADVVTVNTTQGTIKGQKSVSIYDDSYYSFEKIPFAKAPVGELRFKAPEPVDTWQDTLDCTQKPDKPLQKNVLTNEIEGSEDCLYLNVFVKKLQSAKPLPVMVFLFGGGFERGDPTRDLHGPDYFMMKDVILVSISYRVGPFGFLSLEDSTLQTPGNAGLKDQLLGLKWIVNNAANFNGDPSNITLFGESAGAASVHYLMLSPHAKGLFHKAILQSGTVLCPWATSPVKNLPHRLAQATGYKGDNTDAEVLAFLQDVPAEDLVRPYLLTKSENLDDCLFSFGPVVEPYDSERCMIPKQPFELLSQAWGNDIPIMLGGTSFEGLLMYARVHMAPFLITDLKENSEHMLPLELKQKYALDKQKMLAAKIREAHFAHKEIDMSSVLNYCEYATYKVFWHPILRTVKARLAHSQAAATFLYRFDFDSPTFNHQRIKYCGKEVRGVAHVDDHSYIFYGNFSWKLPVQTAEYRTIERMIDIWTTFAANSNPNCKQIEDCVWAPLSSPSDGNTPLKCLNIGEEVKVIDLPEMKKLQIWESLYEAL